MEQIFSSPECVFHHVIRILVLESTFCILRYSAVVSSNVFNSNAIIFKYFEIFKFVWIQLSVTDAIKMATKRKHYESTLKVRYGALKELEKGRPNKYVANQFSIPGRTLATWKKIKEKTFEAFQNSSLKRQSAKTGTYEKLNEVLLK